jgi:predicted GIY-YIG superfamily endonuclease
METLLCQNETINLPLKILENPTGSVKNDSTINIPNQNENVKEKPTILKIGRVYIITNLINNKKYVGVTTRTLKRRFRQHYSQCKKKYKGIIHHAINKYGIENFKIELVEECFNITENELLLKESYYMAAANSFIAKKQDEKCPN